MVKREIVGAHYGSRDWLAQRVTAVVMVVYTAVILSALVGLPPMDYWQWKVFWQTSVVQYATILFILSLLIHAWIGIRNIFMDYIKDLALRLTLYVLVIAALLWYGVWSVRILWSL
jgi:succinate dehydrogenase / fumarate reductase, membrane anchor subunit